MVLVPKQHNANDLMPQSVKTIDFSSCPLYHVKEVLVFFFFYILLAFVLGYSSLWKIKHGQFQYSLECSPSIFCGFFSLIFVIEKYEIFLLIYLNPHACTLVRGVFV